MKKYNIIYCDPPWVFETYSEKGKEKKSAENHYPCLTLSDIKSLPIKNLAEENCALFLWVTSPMLRQGLECIEAWGFTYKTIAFNWFKKNKVADSWFWGLGYWTRQNTELCLLATIGKPTRVSKGVHQVVDYVDTEDVATKLEGHSKKPDVVRERIVELCGDIPRVELFARQRYSGWDSLGDEIDGRDIRDILKQEKTNGTT
jgi:N6-adenosine-specific RNA methylase IME4